MRWKSDISGGVLAIIIASVLWGTTGTAASFTPSVNPLATGAFAMGVGGVLLLLNARKSLFAERNILVEKPFILMLGAMSIAIYPLAFYTSMKWSGVAIGTVVSIATAPFFSMMMERLINKRSITLQWGLSFLLGTVGIVLLVLGKQKNINLNNDLTLQYLGVVLGVVAGLTYATYSWAAKQLIEHQVSSKSAMASMFGIAAVLLLPTLFFTGDNLFSTKINTSVALYMAVIPMFLGYLLFGFGLRHVQASGATLITLLEPVVATVLAILIVGEEFSRVGWLGMLFIALCLFLQAVRLPIKSKLLIDEHYVPTKEPKSL
ncbi:DMT family transporter [Aliiglaciecola lipolytica]|uniref:Drug/metabolite transporter, DME family n=1 Tax=Aliiglaciecola lipolytica E3 TaxID=1127673 RepID=K6Y8U8_9ALTE|nr:EamA family transporter [Aliiglaciecola lipolytica]GAC13083.1 drug/metabolite transporter, DME family [Aliiglaciecola lipolytica E3]